MAKTDSTATFQILIIEDSDSDPFVLAEYLEEESRRKGFEGVQVSSLAEGTELLGTRRFDAILLDLELADSSGEQTFLRLKRIVPELPPTLVLTCQEDEELACRLVSDGAHDCLPKKLLNGLLLRRTIRHAIERRETERSLFHAEKRLAQMEKMTLVARLAGGLAHQLKHPLTRILLNAGCLAEDEIRENHKELLRRISQSAQQADRMVRNLLDFAKNHTHKPEPVSISDCLRPALDHLEECADVAIDSEIGGNIPLIMADRESIEQALLNVAQNALHAVRDKKPAEIIVRAFCKASSPGYVQVQITDNGYGIPPEALSKVFEPFVSSKSRDEGTGLGLAYVQEVVTLHEGYVTIRNRDGQDGVVVTFALPVAG